jgi:hypothetical protein
MIQNCHCIFLILPGGRGRAYYVVIAGHSASKTRVNAHMPGNPSFFEKMDPRVKPGGDG